MTPLRCKCNIIQQTSSFYTMVGWHGYLWDGWGGIVSIFCHTCYFNVIFTWSQIGQLQHRIIWFNTLINISVYDVSEWNALENIFVLIYIRSTSVLYFHGIFIFWISISDVCGCPFSSILYSSISGYGSLGSGYLC